MRTASCSDVRKSVAAALDSGTADHEPVVITRERGKPAAVLMSVVDFASYEETACLLRSPKNAARLRAPVRELDPGKGKARKIAE